MTTTRHRVIAAFVNVAAGATFFAAGAKDGVTVGRGQRVAPPGDFASPDADQIARLTAAKCLAAASGTGPGEKAAGADKGGAVSHADKQKGQGSQKRGGGRNAGDAAGKASGDAESGSGEVAGTDGGGGGDGTKPDGEGLGGDQGGEGGAS